MSFSQTFINVIILFFLAMIIYAIFVRTSREGMTDASGNTVAAIKATSKNGIAGNITSYLATIQAKVIQYQDQFLISKYRTDYENTILKLDDLVDALMLEAALGVDVNNPMPALTKLNTLNGAKLALNSVVKYVDGSH